MIERDKGVGRASKPASYCRIRRKLVYSPDKNNSIIIKHNIPTTEKIAECSGKEAILWGTFSGLLYL